MGGMEDMGYNGKESAKVHKKWGVDENESLC